MTQQQEITNTPVYGGYHPNDLGVNWFGNFRVDSPRVIEFFNLLAGKAAPLVHSVNRAELTFRTSDGGFSLQALRVNSGLRMVVKAWGVNPDVAHSDILRRDISIPNVGSVEQDTESWLETSYQVLQDLVAESGITSLTLPDFDELKSDPVVLNDAPGNVIEYSGTGSAPPLTYPSWSSEEGDFPRLNTDH